MSSGPRQKELQESMTRLDRCVGHRDSNCRMDFAPIGTTLGAILTHPPQLCVGYSLTPTIEAAFRGEAV
jgi:hypothetical protein